METKEKLETYFSQESPFKSELQHLRKILNKTQLREDFKWNAPVYTLNHKHVVGLGRFKNHYGVWFFNGALLEDTYELLYNTQEEKNKALRQLRYTNGNSIDEKILRHYIDEAIANQKVGKEIRQEKTTPLKIPVELENALELSAHLNACFYKLTPEEQNDYAQHIASGKDETDRLLRVEHCMPMISKGMYFKNK